MIHGIALPESVMKTRIRRLYDIANILQSLQLIQKVQVQEASGIKKPAFQYIGPDLDAIGKYLYKLLSVGFLFGDPPLEKFLQTFSLSFLRQIDSVYYLLPSQKGVCLMS